MLVIKIGRINPGIIPRSPTRKLIPEKLTICFKVFLPKLGVNLNLYFLIRINILTIKALEIASAHETKIPTAPNPMNNNGRNNLQIATIKFLIKIYFPARCAIKILSVKKSIETVIVKKAKASAVHGSRINKSAGEKNGKKRRKIPAQIADARLTAVKLSLNNGFLFFALGRNLIIL